jgi:hypothetical protein
LVPFPHDDKRTVVAALGNSGVLIPYLTAKTSSQQDVAQQQQWNAGARNLLRIGTCNVLRVRRSEGGIAVSADVVYPSGVVAAHIRDNNFQLVPPEYANSEAPDKSTLLLRDRNGEELFWIKYLNPNSVKIRGRFACKGYGSVIIKDDEMIIGTKARSNCAISAFPSPPDGAAFGYETESTSSSVDFQFGP